MRVTRTVFSFPNQRRVKSLTTSASACSISFRLASSAKRRPAARKAAMTRRLWPTTWNTVNPARCRSRERRARRAPGERGGRSRWLVSPDADDDARAWNAGLTSQGRSARTHRSLGERGLINVRFARIADSSRDIKQGPRSADFVAKVGDFDCGRLVERPSSSALGGAASFNQS